VLERIAKTTKLYKVDLAGATNILGSKWDSEATKPTLAQAKAGEAGITPVKKKLFFTTDDHKGIPSKLEGIAFLGDGSIALINDDDFGIEGASTKVVVIKTNGRQASAAR